jgi:hypothetical protein
MNPAVEPETSPLGRYDSATDEQLFEVRLLNLPLRLLAEGREQHDEVMREFAVLALDEELDRNQVPKRMLELIDVLGRRYAARAAAPDAQIDAAIARGEQTIDVIYHVPAHLTEAADQLQALMDEADEFCRNQQMLALARSPQQVAFQRWYLEEFRRQIAGQPPRPWDGPAG